MIDKTKNKYFDDVLIFVDDPVIVFNWNSFKMAADPFGL